MKRRSREIPGNTTSFCASEQVSTRLPPRIRIDECLPLPSIRARAETGPTASPRPSASLLVASGILRKRKYAPRQYDYLLTERGTTLFPIVYGFAVWGDTHHAPSKGRRRVFSHTTCGTELDPRGICPTCKTFAAPGDVEIRNGPGAELDLRDDAVTKVLSLPHRLLSPLMISPGQAEVRASRGHTSRKLRG
jgi:hypothetical protein